MNWTIDQLLKTKVGQMPANQAVLAPPQQHDKNNALGSLLPATGKQVAGLPLVKAPSRDSKGKRRVVVCVTIIRFGLRQADDDSVCASYKAVRDSIATSLGVADNDRRVRWQYGQVSTQGEEGTLVTIEVKHPRG